MEEDDDEKDGDYKSRRRFEDDKPRRRDGDFKPRRRFDEDKPRRRFNDDDKPRRRFDDRKDGDYIGKSVYIGGQFRSFNRHEEKKNRLVLSVSTRLTVLRHVLMRSSMRY